MKKVLPYTLALAVLCGVLSLWQAGTPTVAAQVGEGEEEPREYLLVTAEEIQREPRAFLNKYVQVADTFHKELARFPRALRRKEYKVSTESHYGFLTHHVMGSNMICLVEKENETAEKALGGLIAESPVYLRGRVGPRINTGEGFATVFIVDDMLRGHTPPRPKVNVKKKPLKFTIEWHVQVGNDVRRHKKPYTIPKPRTRYKIKDPYSDKYFYMTFEF